MSDARTTPPSFDEMVDLIELNFKEYLKQSKALTAEEIQFGWQRYKTLNHLYQDEIKPGLPQLPEPVLTDEDVKQWETDKRQPYAVWVKASDRLPGYETPVKWRDGKDHTHATDGKIPLIHMAKPFLAGWEWYDESGATPSGGKEVADKHGFRETIEDIIFSAGKHNQEQCSEIADVILRDLSIGICYQKKGETGAGREEDAVEFAEWLDVQRNNRNDIWKDTGIWGKEDAFKLVYELFKSQKEK